MNTREKHYSPEPDDTTITNDHDVGDEDDDGYLFVASLNVADCDDAESPLTMVANKSLDLSRSLTDQCNRLADLTCNDYLWIDDTDVADEIISNSFSTKQEHCPVPAFQDRNSLQQQPQHQQR
ncbi:hypothetical protein HELRODRAFT_159392 [Helobdella robusta]|uniref:Uncharacterized protein n=1 Tax=Helobdella robusta TaxID=6412 RepID=T1ENZ8_HELRO|nr:hypothetical protein HELRODRAFT_159392 [Helobdella robusta]ESO12808.1 hypothetical protein HELRODRAFT_159392 [Helobdella robusta]